MNGTVLVVVVVVILGLGGAAALEGKLLLDAHEKMGDLKVQVRDRQAVIDQNAADAKTSATLAAIQTLLESKLRTVGNDTRQAITNASSDDGAAANALSGVMQLRTTSGRPGPTTP